MTPMTVSVIGLGKIGLPLAAQYASKGHSVIGCDVDPAVVATVNAGRSHVAGEEGLAEAIREAVRSGRLQATTDVPAAVSRSDAVVMIVPMMIDAQQRVDFTQLDAATRAVAQGLRRDSLVVCETTVPVGTTRHRITPLLVSGSKLRAGVDFFVAFSPERVYSGRILADLRRYPKIVGGIDPASTRRAVAFYQAVLDAEVVGAANAETAEFTKLAETSYRDVNIALANQLALYARSHGINAREAFKAANSQPFSHLHTPSIGVGGHCIPVYPYFLLQNAEPEELGMLRLARAVNDGMASVAVTQLTEALGSLNGRTVLILGLSYRENVKELAYSVALRLIPLLRKAGATVLAHDPLFDAEAVAGLGARRVSLEETVPVDAVVVQAFHRDYEQLDWKRMVGLQVVLDGRGALDPAVLDGTGATYIGMDSAEPVRTPSRS